jgi:hypothetical protein
VTVPPVSLVGLSQPAPDVLSAAFEVTLYPLAQSDDSHFIGYSTDGRDANYNDFNAIFWFLGLSDGTKTMNVMSGRFSRYAHGSEDSDRVQS